MASLAGRYAGVRDAFGRAMRDDQPWVIVAAVAPGPSLGPEVPASSAACASVRAGSDRFTPDPGASALYDRWYTSVHQHLYATLREVHTTIDTQLAAPHANRGPAAAYPLRGSVLDRVDLS